MRIPKLTVLFLSLMLVISACTAVTPTPVAPTSTPALVPTTTATAAPSPTATSIPPTPTITPASVSAFPEAAGFQWTEIVKNLQMPINLANAGDGSNRMFILEKKGLIRVIRNGTLQEAAFLDLRNRVGSTGSEQGLLGLAFHPDFEHNGFLYVDYTNKQGDTVIARFTADVTVNPADQKADPASEKILLTIHQPYANHNGGHILFGPDGMLWIGMGDGGSAGDPHGNAQSLQSLLGKLLRIDVNTGDPYSIPTDNPFASGGGLPEIWALGLRNPWQFSFDSLTKDLFVADVGQDKWEEIDFLPAGFSALPANFGWNIKEGTHPYQDVANPPENLIDPIFEYSHSEGCSIIGGGVYHGKDLPEFNGVYLYGDYCSGTIWGLLRLETGWQSQALFQTGVRITAMGTDEQGEVYFVAQNGGLFRLERK